MLEPILQKNSNFQTKVDLPAKKDLLEKTPQPLRKSIVGRTGPKDVLGETHNEHKQKLSEKLSRLSSLIESRTQISSQISIKKSAAGPKRNSIVAEDKTILIKSSKSRQNEEIKVKVAQSQASKRNMSSAGPYN